MHTADTCKAALQGAEVQRTAFITKELEPDSKPSAAALAADAENADFKAKPPMVSSPPFVCAVTRCSCGHHEAKAQSRTITPCC